MDSSAAPGGMLADPSRPPDTYARPYTLGEEIANSVIHGLGVGLSVAALTMLVIFAEQRGNVWALASAVVYGSSLVLEYTASTLYHSFQQPKVKHVFKLLDHAGIYLLIAGSYTPFMLVKMRDVTFGPGLAHGGVWLLAVVWALAIGGIAVEAFWVYRPRWLSAVVYLAMGWLVIVAIGPLSASVAKPGVQLMVAGGIAYTVGTIFYVLKRIRYMHAVWHVFVLAGSLLQFLAILIYVIVPS
jgi:hemolysin III